MSPGKEAPVLLSQEYCSSDFASCANLFVLSISLSQWAPNNNDRDQKKCQQYFYPVEYTTKTTPKTNQKTNPTNPNPNPNSKKN